MVLISHFLLLSKAKPPWSVWYGHERGAVVAPSLKIILFIQRKAGRD